MGGNGPVGRREFEEFKSELAHWRGGVDEWRRAHDEARDDEESIEVRERKWSWPEIVVAAITAAGVIAAAAITAFGK